MNIQDIKIKIFTRSSMVISNNSIIFNNKRFDIRFDQCDKCLFYNNIMQNDGDYAIKGGGTSNKFIANVMKDN